MSAAHTVRIGQPLYGGGFATSDAAVALRFVLPDEHVEFDSANVVERLLEASPQRVEPRCLHFGSCGGCHYQMAAYPEQLRIKRQILESLFLSAGLAIPAAIDMVGAEPYHYRNRIRLRVERVDGALRLGYNVQSTNQFLPILECPIAAPILWTSAQTLLQGALEDAVAASWLNATREIEIFCNDGLSRVQVTLLCPPRTELRDASLERFLAVVRSLQPAIVGMGALALDPGTGRTGRAIASAGVTGLSYHVRDESYWVSRGGFFQVNRFLLSDLVALVCEHDGAPRRGQIAWDLYAGVGLFSRVLARTFERVVAVEANAVAAADNRSALKKIASPHDAHAATSVEFLRAALVQRERPDLVVLDPPRAGAGGDVCELLLKLAPAQMVYVSCDPTTLVRDLQALVRAYDIHSVRLVDLFPQTFHLETVVVLERRA